MLQAKHNSIPGETVQQAERRHGDKHNKSCGTWLWNWGFPISLNFVLLQLNFLGKVGQQITINPFLNPFCLTSYFLTQTLRSRFFSSFVTYFGLQNSPCRTKSDFSTPHGNHNSIKQEKPWTAVGPWTGRGILNMILGGE